MKRFLVLCVIAALIPVATASDGSPDLDGNNIMLFAHTNSNDSVTWINTAKDDPSADPSTVTYYGTSGTSLSRDFVFTGAVGPGAALAADGTIIFNLYAGSGCCVNRGTWTVSLLHGGESIASADTGAVVDTNYNLKRMEVTLDLAAPLELTDDLVWRVAYDGVGTTFMQVGQSGSFSHIVLPLLPAPEPVADVAVPEFFDLNASMLAISLDGLNASNAAHVYNWTNDVANLTVDLNITGNGSVHLAMFDGNATMVHNQTHNASAMFDIVAAMAGNWTINVSFINYTGNFSLMGMPTLDLGVDGSDATPGGHDGHDDGAGNGTEDALGAGAAGKESPGVALPLLAAGLIAIAARRRK